MDYLELIFKKKFDSIWHYREENQIYSATELNLYAPAKLLI